MTDNFPPQLRIKLQADFDHVYQTDVYVADDVLVMRGARNGLSVTRLGLAVSRAVGNAVVRNRWKRRIREAFRRSKTQLPVGLDLLLRPKKGAQLNFDAIRASLVRLAKKIDKRLGAS